MQFSETNLLDDPDLEGDPNAWFANIQPSASANFAFNSPGLIVKIANGGTDTWHVQLNQWDVSFNLNQRYRLTAIARSPNGTREIGK